MFHPSKKTEPRSLVSGSVVWVVGIVVFVFFVLDVPNYKHSDLASFIPTSDSPDSDLVSQPVISDTSSDEESTVAEKASEPPASLESASKPAASVSTTALSADQLNSQPITSGWFIQVGAYKSEVNANVERLKYRKSQIPSLLEKGDDGLTRILLGPYLSEAQAAKAQQQIPKELRHKNTIVREFKPADSNNTAKVETASIEDTPKTDALDDLVSQISTASDNNETESGGNSQSAGSWYIQVGAFKSQANAEIHRLKFDVLNYPTYIESGQDEFSRVLVGPFESETQADKIKGKITAEQKIQDLLVRNIKS